MTSKELVEVYVQLEKKQLYKLAKYGIDYTEDEINEIEEFYRNLSGNKEKYGFLELYKEAVKERSAI